MSDLAFKTMINSLVGCECHCNQHTTCVMRWAHVHCRNNYSMQMALMAPLVPLAGGTDALKQSTITESAGGTALTEEIMFMATGNQGRICSTSKPAPIFPEVSAGVNQWSDGTGVTSRLLYSTTTDKLIFESSDFGTAGTVQLMSATAGSTFKDNMVDRDGSQHHELRRH